jgi:hypothetical protein
MRGVFMGQVNNQPNQRSGAGLWRGALLALCVAVPLWLQGCGGGGGGSGTADVPTQATGAATIDTAGGTVTEASGASVVVPASAFAAATTVRIAKDSTGAPALPTGLTPSGDMYMVTPHGGSFAVPVQVSIPVPAGTLLPTQQLKLAKAELGGEWVVLNDSAVVDGKLTTQVSSFSFFMPVKLTFPMTVVSFAPLAIGDVTVIDCGGQACDSLVGPSTVNVSVAFSGEQLPDYCAVGLPPQVRLNYSVSVGIVNGRAVGTVPINNTFGLSPVAYMYINVSCSLATNNSDRRDFLSRLVYVGHYLRATYPALNVFSLPAETSSLEGQFLSIDAKLMGGAIKVSQQTWALISTPTVNDTATVDWQRSDDNGLSWRNIARSFQYEANSIPYGLYGDTQWAYWASSHGFVAAASDQGALLRVTACYTPRDVPAPPCVTSNATRLNVIASSAGTATAITQAPHSVLVRTGQTASFSATATGTPAPTLQWQTRPANSTGAWTNVSTGTGGTTGNYTTGVMALSDNGLQLRVVATNAVGSAESNPVSVSVSDVDVAPSISTQPGSLNVTTGNDAAFAIAARGTEAMSYQWQYNGAAIAGANSPVLRLAAVTAGQAGSYLVVVSNAAGTVTSDVATLTVSAGTPSAVAPTIVTQPVAVVVNAGNTATMAVGVSGTGPFTYQWSLGGASVSGATAAFYSIPSAAVGDSGSYAVRVSNAAGNVTSSTATLQVNASAQATAPSLTIQPSPQVQTPGGSATFAVAASGTGPLSYQWQKDGASITGATSAVLVVNGINSADAGNYAVTVTNSLGAVTSNAASLTVLGVPAITTQPAAASASEGASATFNVQASGTALGYQWMQNQIAINGATSASYTTPALAMADSGAVYSVVVYNGAGVAISQGAALTVTAAPTPAACTAAPIGASGYSLVFKGCDASNLATYYDKTECVRDNTTGLIWQGQTAPGTGLRANDSTQWRTNYDSTSGQQDYLNPNRFPATQTKIDAITNSIGYKAAVNATNLCGSAAWRLPTVSELLSIAIPTQSPAIDTTWFPNTGVDELYWTSTPDSLDSNYGVSVGFYDGLAYTSDNRAFYSWHLVRLVR